MTISALAPANCALFALSMKPHSPRSTTTTDSRTSGRSVSDVQPRVGDTTRWPLITRSFGSCCGPNKARVAIDVIRTRSLTLVPPCGSKNNRAAWLCGTMEISHGARTLCGGY